MPNRIFMVISIFVQMLILVLIIIFICIFMLALIVLLYQRVLLYTNNDINIHSNASTSYNTYVCYHMFQRSKFHIIMNMWY